MQRKKANATADTIAAPEEGKAVEVHTVVTKFKKEVPAPQIGAAAGGSVRPAAPDRLDHDRDDVDDDDLVGDDGGDEEDDDELEYYDEASAILQEVDAGHPSMVTIYRLPSLRQLGQPGQPNRPAFCGTIELTPDYQSVIQTALGGGQFRLVVRWPAGHHKAGAIRKQWDVQIEPPRLIGLAAPNLAPGASGSQNPPPAYPPPAPPERKEPTLREKLEEMAELRRLMIESGLVANPATTPAAPAEPQTPDAYFLKFAMADETTRAAIISKYLGGAAEGESSSEWIEIVDKYGPLALNILQGLAQHFTQQPPATAPVATAPVPNPQPPTPDQRPQPNPPPPRPQMTAEESLFQFLLNSLQANNPPAQVAEQIAKVEQRLPELVEFVEEFVNTPARMVARLLARAYPAAAPMLEQPGAAEYINAVQNALVMHAPPEEQAEQAEQGAAADGAS